MKQNLIYGLSCPTTGKVYYIGISEHGVNQPYDQLKKTVYGDEVRIWVETLNKEPVMIVLEKDIEAQDLRTRQQYWIRIMSQRGEPLFNELVPNEQQLRFHDFKIGEFIKQKRKEVKLTQREFADKSGLGLRFVRDLEQGKESCSMDKVLHALEMFGTRLVPVVKH